MPHVIFTALTPIFFVMALGYVAGRMRTIDNHHVGEINTLVMDFALPASLFVAISSAARSELMTQAPLFAILGAVMLIIYLLWYLFERNVLRRSRGEAALQALTVAFPNYAGIGLPIATTVLGPTATVPVAVALAAGSILVTPFTLTLLELSVGKPQNAAETSTARVRRAVRHALTKPVVLAPALGLLLSLSGLHLGAVAAASLDVIGQTAGGVALFLTGLVLSAQSLQLDRQVVAATGMADVIRPLLVAAIVHVLPVPSEIAKVSILLAAVPSGFFSILFAENYRVGSAKVGAMVIASTVFSIFTLAITIGILFP
jgi:malonate transporter